MTLIVKALKTVWQLSAYRWLSVISFALFLMLYLLTLPSSFTGGQIGLISLQYLDASMISLSFIMALLVSMIITLMVWLIRQGQKASKASATGGILLGIFTPLLCCSPIIPVIFGSLASLLPSFIGLSGSLFQGFIATHQIELFTIAIILLLLALYQNARKVMSDSFCKIK